jgi:hypothetical protein
VLVFVRNGEKLPKTSSSLFLTTTTTTTTMEVLEKSLSLLALNRSDFLFYYGESKGVFIEFL